MITAVVPFRDWSEDRLRTCTGRLINFSAISEIIVVDFGSQTPINSVPDCRIVRVEADRWCLSEANNIGIVESKTDVVMKIDADMHLDLSDDALTGLAHEVAEGKVSFYVLQATDFEFDESGKPSKKRLRPSWGEGGCNIFLRKDVRNRWV